jgi:hypothetical protein
LNAGHVEDVLHRKNMEARTLQGMIIFILLSPRKEFIHCILFFIAEVSRLKVLHEDLQSSVKKKLQEYGLNVVELGFVPSTIEEKISNTVTLAT